METGLYFGIRLFDYESSLPELTYNKSECFGYDHREYVVVNSGGRLLPFAIKVLGIGLDFLHQYIDAKLVCSDEDVEIETNANDWITQEYNGYTYIYYLANNPIRVLDQSLEPGRYYLDLIIQAGGTRRYYSDPFVVKEFVAEAGDENYSIIFSVIGGNGAISARLAGQFNEIESGISRWANTMISFTATPDSGYVVKEWKKNGSIVANNITNAITHLLTGNINVTVEFFQAYITLSTQLITLLDTGYDPVLEKNVFVAALTIDSNIPWELRCANIDVLGRCDMYDIDVTEGVAGETIVTITGYDEAPTAFLTFENDFSVSNLSYGISRFFKVRREII